MLIAYYGSCYIHFQLNYFQHFYSLFSKIVEYDLTFSAHEHIKKKIEKGSEDQKLF